MFKPEYSVYAGAVKSPGNSLVTKVVSCNLNVFISSLFGLIKVCLLWLHSIVSLFHKIALTLWLCSLNLLGKLVYPILAHMLGTAGIQGSTLGTPT